MAQFSRVAFIGCGNMGSAIVQGLRAGDPDLDIIAVAPHAERRSALESRFGCRTFESTRALIDAELGPIEVVVLAVKPQVMPQVMEDVAELVALQQSLCVSVAAGLDLAFYLRYLPEGARMIRTMPNTPLAYGAGTTLLCASESCEDADQKTAAALFESMGKIFWIPEDEFDAAGAITGCAPAYVVSLIEALAHAGEAEGLDYDVALDMARSAICGSGILISQDTRSASEIRESICSPGGTTLAALGALNEAGFVSAFDQAIHAASERSKELRA